MAGVSPQPHSLSSPLGAAWGGAGQAAELADRPKASWPAEAGGPVGTPSAGITYTNHSGPATLGFPCRGSSACCAPMTGDCPCVQEEKKPLKEGVQDMLVKHHLFSWDIDG